jgi:hypothetical protein
VQINIQAKAKKILLLDFDARNRSNVPRTVERVQASIGPGAGIVLAFVIRII